MRPIWGRFRSRAGIFILLSLPACDAFRTPPATSSSVAGSREETSSIDLLFADSSFPVRIDATDLSPGDYYGTITFTEPFADTVPIQVRVLARVGPRLMDTSSGSGVSQETQSSLLAPLRQADTGTFTPPDWIVPPPAEMESGVEYSLQYLRARSPTGETTYTRIRFSTGAAGAGSLYYNSSSSGRGTKEDPITTQITLSECQTREATLSLEWDEKDQTYSAGPKSVRIIPPTAATPTVYLSGRSAMTIQSQVRKKTGNLYLSSLCGLRMPWSISNGPWLEAAPSSGIIDEDDDGQVVVELYATGGTDMGSYRCTIRVTASESARTKSVYQSLTVAPERLVWLDDPPQSVTSGDLFNLRISPVEGYSPSKAWIEATTLADQGWGYNSSAMTALPMPDGTFVVPVQFFACQEPSQLQLTAWAEQSSGLAASDADGGSLPIEVRVSPSQVPVLSVAPRVLEFGVTSGETSRNQEVRLNLPCSGGGKRLKVSTSHSWIQLAPPDEKGVSDASTNP